MAREENVDCDFVDINCGCPLDEVLGRLKGLRRFRVWGLEVENYRYEVEA